jgi:hypothetical protein
MARELYEEYEELAEQWAHADGEAYRTDEYRKIIMSELVNQASETSVAKAEHWARDHEKYRRAIDEAAQAKTTANVMRGKLKACEMKYEIYRTRNATARAQMTMR